MSTRTRIMPSMCWSRCWRRNINRSPSLGMMISLCTPGGVQTFARFSILIRTSRTPPSSSLSRIIAPHIPSGRRPTLWSPGMKGARISACGLRKAGERRSQSWDVETRFLMLVSTSQDCDLLSPAFLTLQALILAPFIPGDHSVGRLQDGMCGAIILLKLDDGGVREVLLKIENIANVCTPPGVHRLIIIPNDGDLLMFLRQHLDQHILGMIRVLVLIYQHRLEATTVMFQSIRKESKQLHRLHQQVIKIHGVVLKELSLVEPIHFPGHFRQVMSPPTSRIIIPTGALVRRTSKGVHVYQFVLSVGDPVVDLTWRETLRIPVQLFQTAFDHANLVILIVDAEARRVVKKLRLAPENTCARRMKG